MASIKLKGDTSGEITIQAPAVAGTTTLNLPATSSTLATQNALGVRNLIINGDMRIAQRGTSSTGETTGGYKTCDRYYISINTAGTWSITQDTDVPSGQGFANSLKMQCTTADASLASGDQVGIDQRIEGQNLQHLKFGTANAEKITISFWVKSNKTGTQTFEIQSFSASTRYIASTYTIDTADTWEKKTITFNGDTVGSLSNDNSVRIAVKWWLAAGSNFTSGTLNTSWAATATANRVSSSNVNLADSTANYINITGVQLEISDGEATPFEHRPYDMELQRCMRYYQKETTIRPGYIPTTTDTNRHQQLWWKVEMRAAPTITATWAAGSNNVGANTTTGAWIYSAVGDTTTGRNLNSWNASAEL